MRVKVGDLTIIKTGKLDANASSENGNYPFFTCSNEPLRIDSYSYDCECVLIAGNGDLNVKYYKGKFDAYQRTYIIQSKSDGKIFMPYLYLYFQKYIEELRRLSIGGVIKYIKLANLTDAIIDLPSIAEQKRIVNLFKNLQDALNNIALQKTMLDDLVKSRFVEMFGNPEINNQSMPTISMKNVCEVIDGDRGKQYPKQNELTENGYCLFLNAKNVTSNGFCFSDCVFVSKQKDELLRTGHLERGDIVLTTRGTIGNLAYYDNNIPYDNMRINSGMVILRMNHDIISERYFIEQFKMMLPTIKQKIASGSAQPQLPISTMGKINLLLPTLELQYRYSDYVVQIDKSKIAVQKSLDETQKLFDSLMQQYFG